jgi:hypothetical protein
MLPPAEICGLLFIEEYTAKRSLLRLAGVVSGTGSRAQTGRADAIGVLASAQACSGGGVDWALRNARAIFSARSPSTMTSCFAGSSQIAASPPRAALARPTRRSFSARAPFAGANQPRTCVGIWSGCGGPARPERARRGHWPRFCSRFLRVYTYDHFYLSF